jgi:predicted nucleic acid-binding protein
VIAVDTSVVVAGLSPWHERHDVCRELLDQRPTIIGHALVESFSVLIRLPAPYRMPGQLAAELLTANFTDPPLVLSAAGYLRFLRDISSWWVVGGAVYDALIAITAQTHAATLATLDERAARTYLMTGADTRLM